MTQLILRKKQFRITKAIEIIKISFKQLKIYKRSHQRREAARGPQTSLILKKNKKLKN